jgi:hypothetical protein
MVRQSHEGELKVDTIEVKAQHLQLFCQLNRCLLVAIKSFEA